MTLKRGSGVIEPYDPSWVRLFEEEKSRIQPIFGEYEVYHTGSTSVLGLPAKPIIDMLVGLPSLADFERYRGRLEVYGYVSMPERKKDWEIFIPKGPDDARTHYLHVLVKGSPEYKNILYFRNYLRAHPEVRDAYAALKHDLAAKYPDDRPSYTAAKHDFIEGVIEHARQEQIAI